VSFYNTPIDEISWCGEKQVDLLGCGASQPTRSCVSCVIRTLPETVQDGHDEVPKYIHGHRADGASLVAGKLTRVRFVCFLCMHCGPQKKASELVANSCRAVKIQRNHLYV
jgi:hypothetical protein